MRRCGGPTVVVVVAVAVVAVVVAQQQTGGGGQCHSQRTCGSCIQTPGCQWCVKPLGGQGAARPRGEAPRAHHCQPHTANSSAICNPDDIHDPANQVTVLENLPLSELGRSTEGRIIQLAPQRMRLRLRKGVSQEVQLRYRLATDYPVDLYYLMDLSNSMSDDKQQLAALGSELASLLSSLTSQFRLGFGSFVDKVLMPFADTSPYKLETPCKGCARPYSFRNDLPLDDDPSLFTERVMAANISGNLDSPEGGFDALMQAMVCDEIGWREQARKILVFSTDAKFHHAGDGRLAGVIVPNDETCHLNHEHEYTNYDTTDYPSIAQISKVAKERNINVILAVSGHASLYRRLSELIETASYGQLTRDSSNVVKLVEDQYDRISSVVRLTDNSDSSISVKYWSRCKGSGAPLPTHECTGIKSSDTIDFTLQITALRCPADGQPRQVEVRTLQDKLVLDIEVLCTCDCDNPEENVPGAAVCSGAGSVVCGVCQCNQGHRGDKCQCSNDRSDSSEEDQRLCMAGEGEPVCSGLGFCSCGTCLCREADVHGTYCQCNRRNCLSGMGLECSGHGSCSCNECLCEAGFTGHLCQCPDNSKCFGPDSEEECSGHGRCVCGRCKCQQDEGITYTGRYCEECPSCRTGRCSEFRDCVQCQQFDSGPLRGSCQTCTITTHSADSLDDQVAAGAKQCVFEDEEGCYFNFTYLYKDTVEDKPQYDIYVQKEPQCPPPPPIQGIVFGLIGGIVAIGVLTLIIWKVVTTLHDRREYARFEKERQNAKWNAGENPLYKGAQTTFQNPAFAQQQAT